MAAFVRSLVLVLMASILISTVSCDDGDDLDPYEVLCSPVWGYFPYCAKYLGGLSHNPPKACCHNIRKLNEIAKKTKKGQKVVCFCIEAYMVPQDFRLKAARIKELPKKCHTDVMFPISERMDCSTQPLRDAKCIDGAKGFGVQQQSGAGGRELECVLGNYCNSEFPSSDEYCLYTTLDIIARTHVLETEKLSLSRMNMNILRQSQEPLLRTLALKNHPLNVSVEDQLDRLRSSQTISTSAYLKLSGLKDLYECVGDFLHTTRNVFSSMKECLQELESSLRRRKGGESGFAREVEAYLLSRKQLNKIIRKWYKILKSMEKNCNSAVDEVGMLREVKEISLEIFQSLLSLVPQPKARSSSHGWSVVSKLFQSKRVSCEGESTKLEKIDAELLALKPSKDINPVQVQNVLKGLKALESNIQEAVEELEAIYRKLLKSRVSLLNILSH
ncbi:unnamed protein product [Dovyalis caffra]|uniref:Bifunctional inhibitor/plant lipid transfer protein/seed storage helical domain-containing protein n=1 Tax=Dovyalis caffra TaxID=77055 RepID=A0AAV1S766_9ROSI|nr:unnamed protein product [Dovyalis caffra]